MTHLRKHTNFYLSLVLLGVMVFCNITVLSIETSKAEDNLPGLLHQILTLELQGVQFTEWDEENKILHVVHNNADKQIYLYKLINQDLDGDGMDELIVGCKFIDKMRFDDEDFLAVYTIRKDERLSPLFRKHFQNTDKGEFTDLQVEDIVGNKLPEIRVEYNFVTAGGNRWKWEDHLYIIRGWFPFDTLLELKVHEGKRGRGSKYYMKAEIEVKDVDRDGINEIIAIRYEGEDEFELQQVTPQPLIYRVSFKLTPHALEHIRNQGIPDEVLQELESLEEQEIATKGEFLSAVEQQIGKEETEKYERLFVQYAIYRYRLEGELQ